MDQFCGSKFWDPALSWNTSGTAPDLTVCFQNTVLAWIPCAFLWLACPLEVYYLYYSHRRFTPWTWLNLTKCCATSLCLLVSLMEFIFAGVQGFKYDDLLPPVYFYTPFIKSATMFLALIFILAEKRKGFRSSGIIFNFWFLAFLCGLFTYRSLLLRSFSGYQFSDGPIMLTDNQLPNVILTCQMIYYPMVALNVILNCFSDASPMYKQKAIPRSEKECPEKGASFPSRMLFSWFTGLVIRGFKEPLELKHLWVLNYQDRSVNVAKEFDKNWDKEIRSAGFGTSRDLNATYSSSTESINIRSNGASHSRFSPPNAGSIKSEDPNVAKPIRLPTIVNALARTFWPMFVLGASMKFLHDILQFVQPKLLEFMIDFIKNPDQETWKGVMYAALMFASPSLQSIVLSVYFQRMCVVGMRMRTALVSAIYRKSLVLSSSAKRTTTTGEIVNLMSNDAQKFMELMVFLNMIWSAPLQIALSVYFLWQILGVAVIAGLAVMICMIPLNAVLASFQKKLQTDQMKYKDDRIRLMNEILSGMKVLKLYAWESKFQDFINAIRSKEILQLKQMAYLNAGSSFLWTCAPFLVSLVSFLTYVLIDSNNVLNPEKAFVSLTLFHILRFPLSMLPVLISMLVEASVSVKRINKFLSSHELSPYVLRTDSTTTANAISIDKGSFAWSQTEKAQPTLRNISLEVKRGNIVAIVGTVGCGKSSVLNALLGFMEKVEGEVEIHGKVAYVAQQTWIQNATLRDNVLFNKAYDAQEYWRIIDACALKSDLEILPGGDQTEIGEKGINVSGGQKQRISIARACYSDADIYLFDDPLSALDSHVGKHIFDKVIGRHGILKGKTRVLATHGISFLPHVDQIIVIDGGEIREKGTYQELLAMKGAFADVLMQFVQEESESEKIDESKVQELQEILSQVQGTHLPSDVQDTSDKLAYIRSASRCYSRSSSLSGDSAGRSRSTSVDQRSKINEVPSTLIAKKQLIQTETAETGKVDWSVYFAYFSAMGFIWVFCIAIFNLLSNIFALLANVLLAVWSNDPPLPDGSQDLKLRNSRLQTYAALGLVQGLIVLLASFSLAFGSVRGARTLQANLLYNVLRSPMSFFDTTPLGRIINRFSKDVDTVDLTIPQTIRSWTMCFLQVMVTLLIITYNAPIFLVFVFPVGLLYCGIRVVYIKSSRQLKRLESVTRSPIYSHFSETLAGVTTIRAYQAEELFVQESNKRVDVNQQCYYPSAISNRWLAIRLEFCGNLVVLVTALFAVYYRNTMDGGKVGLMLSYALSVTAVLNWFVRMSSDLETNIVSVERISEYTKSANEAEWRIENKKPPADWPQKGEIIFDHYGARYRDGLDLVIKDITARVNPGEKVGIVGRTGAGKSTLTLALFRLIEPAKGKIFIDGLDITDMGLHDLREKLTIIPQDPVLFSGTIRLNLDPFGKYTDEEMWKALEHSHLKTFVSSMDKKLDYEVTESGENLSVGQRQLICLARSLLRKTRILFLDEATAAVDLETDELIQKTIRSEFKECTIMTIAHRLNTIMDYDRIMVLDKGYIKEFDSPADLLQNKSSIFYAMAKDAKII